MTPEEAAEEVGRLKGLFTMTTRERAEFWFAEFQKYPRAVVQLAVDEFAQSHGDAVDPGGLLTLIQARMDTAEIRAARAKQQAIVRVAQIRRQKQQAEASFANAEQVIASLPDAKLDFHKAEIFREKPELEPFLSGKNPRESLMLKSMIAKRVAGT
jgi:hypothetical protein